VERGTERTDVAKAVGEIDLPALVRAWPDPRPTKAAPGRTQPLGAVADEAFVGNSGHLDFLFFAENGPDMLCRIDAELIYTYVSPRSFTILGWRPDEMVGKHYESFLHPDDVSILREALQAIEQEKAYRPLQLRHRSSAGTWVWLEASGRHVYHEDGTIQDRLVIMRDITERKEEELRLARLALTDGLTGLLNRRAFDEILDREWRRTLREGSQTSLLLLDVDHFKGFNDMYGHQMGDDCLRAVAFAVSSACSRPTDVVARYGGEEIGVILPGLDGAGAATVAERIRAAVESLNIVHDGNGEGSMRVTASIGVATALSRHGGSLRMPESLLIAADAALYRAKHGGRNRVATALLMASKETPAVHP
jgi:diguanylate cyclase (GGDEF)-like protein/PAS domain S-box-containing protein